MLTKTYYWKELSSDGLLKEPKEVGAYYESESINNYYGFASEEDAIIHLTKMCNKHEFCIPDVMLITEYKWRT